MFLDDIFAIFLMYINIIKTIKVKLLSTLCFKYLVHSIIITINFIRLFYIYIIIQLLYFVLL